MATVAARQPVLKIAAPDLSRDLDLTDDEVQALLTLAGNVKRTPGKYAQALAGRYIGLLFEKPSLRTRLTFELAIKQLGGDAVFSEGRLGAREPIKDVARNLDRWVQGIVARLFHGGFAISMKLPPLKREKLAEQLTWLANRQDLGMPEDRRHERIIARNPHTTLTLPGGKEYMAKIIDVSRSGVALSVAVTPPVGTPVTVGATRGQVVRAFGAGMAVEFSRVIPEDSFNEDVVL